MRLRIFSLALGVCLVVGLAAAQQEQMLPAIGTWHASLGDMGCIGFNCCRAYPTCCTMGPCQRHLSVFTPNAPIVITRVETLAIVNSNSKQLSSKCSTAAIKLHSKEQTYAEYVIITPYMENDAGAIYADSGEMTVGIEAGTRMWMSFSGSLDCQIQDVKVTVQYQTVKLPSGK